jgi:colanic acid/amylovoran biosynthesis protein
MQFLLAGNSTYTNHGSEAIVRGTVIILREFFEHPEIVSAETERFPYSDVPESDPGIIHKPVFLPKPHSIHWFSNQVRKAIFTRPVAYKHFAKGLLPEIKKADVVLSLGGDGYRKKPFLAIAENDLAIEAKTPVILWGASVEPFAGSLKYQKSVFNHLRRLTGIFVRETISQQYLADNGIKDNVYLVEDPAFLMEPEMPDDPEFVENLPRGAIGISLSGLFLNQTRFAENHEDAVYRIVEAVRQRFGRPIILVPHCVDYEDNDYALLDGVLKANASHWPDVICLPKLLPAAQIKWVISKLHAFVGARAHATIAAFSTYVPTVSLVYSFKGEGFNQHLFGCLDYVVKTEQCEPEIIAEKLDLVLDNHDEIRKTLQEKMIKIKKGAMRAGHLLKKIISNSSVLER